jgi:hypothetical protein
MSGTSGLQPHEAVLHSVGTGERLSPTQTQPEWTEAQKAAWKAREEARKHWAGGRTFLEAVGTPAQQEADRAAQRDAEERRLRERWPAPRQQLRDAHAALADARDDLRRRRDILARAADHLGAMRVAHGEAVDARQSVDAQAVERLIAANFAAELTEEPTPERSDKTARDVELAEAAHRELSDAVVEAERAEARAQKQVADAALATTIAHGLEVAEEIAGAEERLAAARRRLWGVDKIWLGNGPIKLPQRIVIGLAGMILHGADDWPAAYRALLSDAEAALP